MSNLTCDDDSFGEVRNVNTQKCCRKIITIKEVVTPSVNTASVSASSTSPPVCTNYGSLTSTVGAGIPSFESTDINGYKTVYFAMPLPDTLDSTNIFKFNRIQFLLHNLIPGLDSMGTVVMTPQDPNGAQLRVYIYKMINVDTMTGSLVARSVDTPVNQTGFTEVVFNETVEVTNAVENSTNSSPYYMAVTLVGGNRTRLLFAGNSITLSAGVNPGLFGYSGQVLASDTSLGEIFANFIMPPMDTTFSIPFYVLYNI